MLPRASRERVSFMRLSLRFTIYVCLASNLYFTQAEFFPWSGFWGMGIAVVLLTMLLSLDRNWTGIGLDRTGLGYFTQFMLLRISVFLCLDSAAQIGRAHV